MMGYIRVRQTLRILLPASATRALISASNCLSGGIKLLALGIAYNNNNNNDNMRTIKVMYVKIFQVINEKLVQRRHGSTSNYLFSFFQMSFVHAFFRGVLSTAGRVC